MTLKVLHNQCQLSAPQNCPKHYITAIFSEMLTILGEGNSIDFVYANDKRGRAIIVPQVKTLSGFMEQARKLKWLDKMLEHMLVEITIKKMPLSGFRIT